MPYNITEQPVGLLNLDLEDFQSNGLPDPSEVEVSEVIAYLRRHYKYDEAWVTHLKDAMSLVKSKRDLF